MPRPTLLKASNAPVAPLVLHGVVGGGSHLPSGDPTARLPCLFHKKKYEYARKLKFVNFYNLYFPLTYNPEIDTEASVNESHSHLTY